MNALAFFVRDTFGRMSLLLILIAGIVLVDYKMKYLYEVMICFIALMRMLFSDYLNAASLDI